jgi:hypothetical protein
MLENYVCAPFLIGTPTFTCHGHVYFGEILCYKSIVMKQINTYLCVILLYSCKLCTDTLPVVT